MYIGGTAVYLNLKFCSDLGLAFSIIVLAFETIDTCCMYYIQKILSPTYMFELQIVCDECKFCQLSFSLRRYLCNRTNCILEILLEWVSFCGIRIMTIITKKENFTAPMRKRIKTPHPISLTSRMCIFTDDFFSHFPRSPPQHFFLLALSPPFLVS